MVIGRSEDRDNPWNPLVLRHHVHVWDPIRVPHLGQRSYDRTTKAGHMTAFDQTSRCQALARRGPSTYDCIRPDIPLPSPCETGAVHICIPACTACTCCRRA